MSEKAIGTVEANEDGNPSLSLVVDQVSRAGEVNEATVDLLSAHIVLAKRSNDLAQGQQRATHDQLAAKYFHADFNGKEEDVNFDIHKDLAALQCKCHSMKFHTFERAAVFSLGHGFFSNLYRTAVWYRCQDCGNTISASGSFQRTGFSQLFKNH